MIRKGELGTRNKERARKRMGTGTKNANTEERESNHCRRVQSELD